MTTAFDSTVPADIPGNAEVVLYYADGGFKWSAADLARFPLAEKGGITVTGLLGVQIIDCEPGAVWPPMTAANLARRDIAAGLRPTIYADASNWPLVDNALASLGLARETNVDGWIAAYDGVAVVPAGYVAKQYASHNTHPIYDLSVTNGVWPFQPHPAPPPETIQIGEDQLLTITIVENQIHIFVLNTITWIVKHWWQSFGAATWAGPQEIGP